MPPFRWPLLVLDIEASSLEDESYPVEIGLALLKAPGEPLLTWSALIAPTNDWCRTGHWSRRSQSVHGLDRDQLQAEGLPPHGVAATLTTLVPPNAQAWCDGGDYDRYWLHRLFDAATLAPSVELYELTGGLARLPLRGAEAFYATLSSIEAEHRAGADALRLLRALVTALDVPYGPVVLVDVGRSSEEPL